MKATTEHLNTFCLSIAILFTFHVSAQQAPSTTGSSLSQVEAQSALDFHNKVREDVNVAPLNWSVELSAYAQQWANQLSIDCKLQHRPGTGQWAQKYGENIFWGGGTSYTVLDASESWYSEIKDYRYGPLTGSNWYKTGHYTQMVWKTTTHVGIGKAVCKNGAIIIVANYSPSGNYLGERPY